MDELLLRVEPDEATQRAGADGLEAFRGEVARKLQTVLGVRTKVEIVAPHSLTRTDFKARRVVDDMLDPHVPVLHDGLAAAVEYLQALGMDKVEEHELAITGYALEKLAEIPGVTVIGPPDTVARGGAISFTVEGIHPHDVGQVLDDRGVAVRTGHHCAWPLHRRLGIPATTRASFSVYTNRADIDAFVEALDTVPAVFGLSA